MAIRFAPGEFFRDTETGSLWTLLGVAYDGELAQQRLTPLTVNIGATSHFDNTHEDSTNGRQRILVHLGGLPPGDGGFGMAGSEG